MSPDKPKLHDYAGGWITEREGTAIPGFLKLAYIVIMLCVVGYFLVYMNGEVDNPGRGPLVRAFNAATESSGVLMYLIAGLIVVYGVIVVAFAFREHD